MIAGVLAGLTVLLASLAFRFGLGVPLPVDLVSDRFLPLVPVEVFVPALGILGGPVLAKELAFYSSFLVVVGLGVAASLGYARIGRRRVVLAGAAALAGWLVTVAVLWPALRSNYHGVPPGSARPLTAGVLALLFVLLAGVLAVAQRGRA